MELSESCYILNAGSSRTEIFLALLKAAKHDFLLEARPKVYDLTKCVTSVAVEFMFCTHSTGVMMNYQPKLHALL